jgi:phenylacetate-CoA ligase
VLRDRLHAQLADAYEGLNFLVERAETGALPRFELKARRTVDERKGHRDAQ